MRGGTEVRLLHRLDLQRAGQIYESTAVGQRPVPGAPGRLKVVTHVELKKPLELIAVFESAVPLLIGNAVGVSVVDHRVSFDALGYVGIFAPGGDL